MSIHVFGIRHHGPGCARHLRAALEELQPDIVLVEGPPDAQDMVPLITAAGMQPPVALLLYSPEQPKQAVYYPFAIFSPEWQALNYAQQQNIPARFMDLPQAFQLGANEANEQSEQPEQESVPTSTANSEAPVIDESEQETAENQPVEQQLREDPLSMLARAAGFEGRAAASPFF